MVARAHTEAEIAQLAAQGTAELRARFSAADVDAPPPVNVVNAVALIDGETLEYRGRRYPVRPIGALDGLRLMVISSRLAEAQSGPDPLAALRASYADVLREVHRLCRPPGWRGWLWRLRRNPFRDATFAEVKQLLDFCARCQTTSSVRYRGQVMDNPVGLPTSSR
jgi:hypothetical protein